jgi:tRNA threonylcarbamoyladenosine biosynthesis protein TsaE
MNTDHPHVTLTKRFAKPDAAAKWIMETCDKCRILCFAGDLGAGKTTTIQSCCRVLGYHGEVTSPTYAIINEYADKELLIYHMDLYRLRDIDEALAIGLDEYLYDMSAYSFVEWPLLLQDNFSVSRYDITISVVVEDQNIREVSIVFVPE